MESINPVYLDNRVVRKLIENPEIRIDLFNDFAGTLDGIINPLNLTIYFSNILDFIKKKLEIPEDLHALRTLFYKT